MTINTKQRINRMKSILFGMALCIPQQMCVYGFPISPNVTAADFDDKTLAGAAGIILGTVFWILRLLGAILAIYGIYATIVAKKDGDANEMNKGQMKFLFGILFLAMPQLLRGLKIIN